MQMQTETKAVEEKKEQADRVASYMEKLLEILNNQREVKR